MFKMVIHVKLWINIENEVNYDIIQLSNITTLFYITSSLKKRLTSILKMVLVLISSQNCLQVIIKYWRQMDVETLFSVLEIKIP
mgnify:FL=1